MISETVSIWFPLLMALIALVGLLLWKLGDGRSREIGRNIIYGPFGKPFKESLARIFEKPLTKREKLGWSIVLLLLIIAFVYDHMN